MGKIRKVKSNITAPKPTGSRIQAPSIFKAVSQSRKPSTSSNIPNDDVVDEFKDFSLKADRHRDISVKKVEILKKSGKIKKLSKKDKQDLKKEEVLQKIELTKKAFVEEKDRKKREKTAVVKDMRPLMDALPSLDSLLHFKKSGDLRTGVPAFDMYVSKKQKTILLKVQKQLELQHKLDTHKNLVSNLSQMTPAQRKEAIQEMTMKRMRQKEIME